MMFTVDKKERRKRVRKAEILMVIPTYMLAFCSVLVSATAFWWVSLIVGIIWFLCFINGSYIIAQETDILRSKNEDKE